ncbi:hypothetical protein KC332_g3484 [Hortaea werneckii]|uniref:Swi5-domain-containing protein n=2 Tax=Hortaea werneckii TaxID=91943 RepID=A0A3M7J920_HORWE|nr:hypothetical protein KC350_g11551 [Hortaea werneckii]OTA24547.1 hypothetical protein BTJ68_12872 [Hortaea werneckii EXF-2000]KAI6839023.1 hypothetical protein KC358_g4745 [Hortaea werneckii]KAI6940674.1 hypothetical protein KC341_g3359 [Hortaea werneckii]KAI6945189.1 hypothetical protein KC348_g3789 [Hortaea werneckii]
MSSQEETTTRKQQAASSTAPPSSDSTLPSSPAPPRRNDNTNMTTDKQQETDQAGSQTANLRLGALESKRQRLLTILADLQAQRSQLVSEAKLPSGLDMPSEWSDEQKNKQALATANGVIKDHIQLLHKYNEMKDIGLGLMGLIADKRGVRIGTVMEDFGMDEKD